MTPEGVDRFCPHLSARNHSPHAVESYKLGLRLFFDAANKPAHEVTWRDVDRFAARQHRRGLAATTVNRRPNAVKRCYDYLGEESPWAAANPVKPSHFLRPGRPLPRKMSREQVKRFFAVVENRMGRALFLPMLRGSSRVSGVVRLKIGDIDWEQKSLLVEQGKGRKDRLVYLSADALAALHECLRKGPLVAPGDCGCRT